MKNKYNQYFIAITLIVILLIGLIGSRITSNEEAKETYNYNGDVEVKSSQNLKKQC